MMSRITSKYTTICTVGYSGAVSRDENRSAHGGVCHIQIRRAKGGKVLARKVNTNGRHHEIGEAFEPSDEQLAHWGALEKSAR